MSLKGSLDTLKVTELLQLLARTSKTGQLRIGTPGDVCWLWLEDGRLTGFEQRHSKDAVDAMFFLLRLESADFTFATGTPERSLAAPEEIAPLLDLAKDRLSEWDEIASVIPSLDHDVCLVPTRQYSELTLGADLWPVCLAIGEGHQVRDVIDRAGLSEFDACRKLKELVDAELATVQAPPQAGSTGLSLDQMLVGDPGSLASDLSFMDGVGSPALYDQMADDTEWAPEDSWEMEPAGERVSRGFLLRILSSVRS